MKKTIKLASKLQLQELLGMKRDHMARDLQCDHSVIHGLLVDPNLDCYIGFSRPTFIDKETIEKITGMRIVLSKIGTRIVDIHGEVHNIEHSP